jgi:hypothetical protein
MLREGGHLVLEIMHVLAVPVKQDQGESRTLFDVEMPDIHHSENKDVQR